MTVLVFNAGSSTVKLAAGGAVDSGEGGFSAVVSWGRGGLNRVRWTGADGVVDEREMEVSGPQQALRILRAGMERGIPGGRGGPMPSPGAIGHRVVHGGERFRGATRVDGEVIGAIRELGALAPLHNPVAADVMEAAADLWPRVPQVAVFDTEFFAGMDPRSYLFPVPWDWRDRFGIRRYGFHGINHEWCYHRAAGMLGRGGAGDRAPFRVVSCHLGNGCSATATLDGRPVTTSMGFTPLDGLMMGTRSGSVDPGILLHLQKRGWSAEDLEHALNRESGLRGVSGLSSDYREVAAAAREGHVRSRLALEMMADRIRGTVASLASYMNGLDALVFSGGIGENAPELRERVVSGLGFMGVALDPGRNGAASGEADLSASDAAVRTLCVPAGEERWIARKVRDLLGGV